MRCPKCFTKGRSYYCGEAQWTRLAADPKLEQIVGKLGDPGIESRALYHCFACDSHFVIEIRSNRLSASIHAGVAQAAEGG
jgi:hypothetical protein